MLNFQKITITDTQHYVKHLGLCMQIISDSSPTIILSGCEIQQRAYQDGFCWQKGHRGPQEIWLPPIGDWDVNNWQQILIRNVPKGTIFNYVPEYLLNVWVTQVPKYIDFTYARNDSDYIYYVDRQVKAGGKAYAEMRNNRNSFIKHHDFAVQPITIDVVPQLLATQDKFMQNSIRTTRYNRELLAEDKAFRTALGLWDQIPYMQGIYVTINGQIAGFSIWEELDHMHAIGLFTKSDYTHKTLPTFLCTEVYSVLKAKGISIINTMSDVGLENLRKSKARQNPLVMIRKYSVIWNG